MFKFLILNSLDGKIVVIVISFGYCKIMTKQIYFENPQACKFRFKSSIHNTKLSNLVTEVQ